MHFLILYKKALRYLDRKMIDLKNIVTLILLTLCPTTSETHGKIYGPKITSTSLTRGTSFKKKSKQQVSDSWFSSRYFLTLVMCNFLLRSHG